MSKPYPSEALTEVCEMLRRDYDLSLEQIANLAADIPGECDAMCEQAWERQQQALSEGGGPDDSAYRRDMINAGRGSQGHDEKS